MESKTYEREWKLYSVGDLPSIIMGQLIGSEIHSASISPKLFKTNEANYNHYKCINLVCNNEGWFWCKIFIHRDKYDEIIHQEIDYHLQAESIRQKLGDNSKFETAHMAVTTRMADWLSIVEGMNNIQGQWATILACKIDGIILNKCIQKTSVSFTDVCLILNSLTEFVNRINNLNIIHLGINPQDIMIVCHENKCIIKILDWTKYFGTSALVSKTELNQWLPRDMLLATHSRTFTTQCNNWMLGITVWYCFASWLKQHNQINIELAPFASATDNINSVYTDRAKMPPSIYDICHWLFNKEPEVLQKTTAMLNKASQMYEASLMRELQYLPTKEQMQWTRSILASLNTQEIKSNTDQEAKRRIKQNTIEEDLDEPPTRKQLRLEHDDTIQEAVQAAFKDK